MQTALTKADIEHLKKRSADIFAALRVGMERGTAACVQKLVQDMENTGKELMKHAGGREKALERMENFKRYQPLMPQAGQPELDRMRAKMKPFQDNMRKLFEYLRRAKA